MKAFFAIILILLGLLCWTGYQTYDLQNEIGLHEKALKGDYFLLPITDEDLNIWTIKSKELDIWQKEEELKLSKKELAMLRSGTKMDFTAEENLILEKYSTAFTAIDNKYLNGHNPPANVIQEKIREITSKRNLYGIGFGLVAASLLVFIFSQRAKRIIS